MVPMLKMLNLLLLLLLPSLLSLGPGGAIAQTGSLKKSTTPFHVGVILDTESWIGNISWSCMTMALQDFYATHRNYTTRLAFHLRDSGHDPLLGAASAAIDLLKNVQVRAIIGPQRSAEAKFVMHIGDRTQVPIISFSAKSPSLSSKQAPYFIRTAWNDSSQAKVIASFVQAFGWGEVVPVFEDTEYDGIVPYLIDAFQEIDAHVPYRSIIPPSFTKDQILEELKRLKKMQTRVFVVHMSYSLGFQFFSSAKQAGMMEKEYVWITTYSVTDIVDLLGSSATDVMQGVLGVKPYVNETKKLTDFKVRWRKKFHHENSIDEVAEPTFFGLWAYDTVWALAIAAESVGAANYSFRSQVSANSSTDLSRLGYSPTGPELRGFMQSINFSGMSGEFHMVDGQLESKAFEIINVVEHGKRRIGFWTPAYGISQDMDSKAHVKDIMWPGKSRSVPKGSEWPTMGIKLRIGVPVKPGFLEFVNTTHQPGTNKVKPTGFCIEVFDAVMKALPYTVDYEYFRYEDSKGESNGTYDDLVYQVYLQKFDAVVGDVTIIANRSLYVDFTLPYTESGVVMVVPVKDKRHKSAWTFLEPLTTNLWLASGAFFVFTGFVVWVLEHRINDEFRGSPSHQLGTVFYFSFSTLVFAHREKVVNNLTRVVVIIWVFVVLILQSSYTASLTSKLTVQQLQPTVTDLNQIIKDGSNVGYLKDSFTLGLLNRLKVNNLTAYLSPDDFNDALSNGSVAAIVDEIPYIKVFLSKYRNKYTMVGPTYKTGGFGFVFPKGSPLVPDVSRAILNVTESDNMTNIEKKYKVQSCPNQDSTPTSNSLTFDSFWGLFLITGIVSLSALILSLVCFLFKYRDVFSTHDSENFSQRIALLARLFNQIDPTSKALEQTKAEGGPAVSDVMASPSTDSEPESPTSISFGHENFGPEEDVGSPLEEEGTPGREISSQNPVSLSAWMTSERD